MRHREVITYIARRLPHQTQREMEEVVDVLIELMQDRLVQGKTISLPDIGMLWIEVQEEHAAGAVRQRPSRKQSIKSHNPWKT
jgi:nucleoid DNA-binding protein